MEGKNRLTGAAIAGGARALDAGRALWEHAAQDEFRSELAAEAASMPLRDKSPIGEAIDGLMHHISELDVSLSHLRARLDPVMAAQNRPEQIGNPPPSPNEASVLSMIDFAAYRVVAIESAINELRERLQV